jgi:hypothetical protein|tara:strand:+ start:17593 stop:17796 length:204 start_codon:yes stop_codon:yes gene_type:complete
MKTVTTREILLTSEEVVEAIHYWLSEKRLMSDVGTLDRVGGSRPEVYDACDDLLSGVTYKWTDIVDH